MTSRWTSALFARMTRLLPRDLEAELGADMRETFARRSADARRRGPVPFALFFARELAGLTRVALVERIGTRRERGAEPNTDASGPHWRRAFRLAGRRLVRTPGFSGVAVLTLALAIGATSAVFTLVHRIVLARLPYPASERLIALDHAAPGVGLQSGIGMSIGVHRQYAQLPSIETIALYDVAEGTLTGAEGTERIQYLFTTPALGSVLGLRAAVGRWFTDDDGVAGSPNVVVLSDALWRRSYGGSPRAVGQTLRLDGRSYEIVGVLPPDFAFPDPTPELVIPLALPRVWERAAGFNYRGIARVAPGVTIDEARREQNAVLRDLPRRYPSDPETRTGMIASRQIASITVPYKQRVLGSASSALWVLLGAAAVMLAMACANLANLFLVRADSRHREIALRRALGAGPSDIVRYFVAESLLVAITGGLAALGITYVAIEAVVGGVAVPLPRLNEVRVDATTVAFTAAASIVAGVGLGFVCVMRYAATQPSSLSDVERAGTASRAHMRSRHTLMAVQLSLAVVLLASAGLALRSYSHLVRVDLGFRADSALVFRVGLPRSLYRGGHAAAAFHERAMQHIRSLPGVERVALTSTLPLDGAGLGNPIEVLGAATRAADASPVVRFRRVSEDYFATMGMRVRDGRTLADRGGRGDVVIDDALATAYFAGQNPIGRRVRAVGEAGQEWLTVVGVVTNTVASGLYESAPTPQLYVALGDSVRGNLPAPHDVTYVVRVAGAPTGWASAVRRAFAEVDRRVPLWRLETLATVVARARAGLSFTLVLLVIAASMGLVLGVVGVYGVISYSVRQRGAEIGVRIALGATPGQVTGMVVRQSGGVIVLGVVAGVVASLAAGHLLSALLFGVTPMDAPTHAITAVFLLVVALIACWLPARAAARLSPLAALRGR